MNRMLLFQGKRQTLMFSATFPEEVQKLAWNYLDNYIFVNTGIIGGTNPHVCQEFFEVNRSDKRNKLSEVLGQIGNARTIIFVESKKTADFVAAFLCNTQFQVS
jgi:probable ATP-dependent RNA helicase DDX4